MMLALWLVAAANAQGPFNPYLPRCGLGASYDSYSLGMAEGFEQLGVAPVPVDDLCYRLGLAEGRGLSDRHAGSFDKPACEIAYADGKRQGLSTGPHTVGSPSDCSNDGFAVGSTLISIYARLGAVEQVSPGCLRSYSAGRVDGYGGRPLLPSSGDPELRRCYRVGHEDGETLRAGGYGST